MSKRATIKTTVTEETKQAFSAKAETDYSSEAAAVRSLIDMYVNDNLGGTDVSNDDIMSEIRGLRDDLSSRTRPTKTDSSSNTDSNTPDGNTDLLELYDPGEDGDLPDELTPDMAADDANYNYNRVLSKEVLKKLRYSNKSLNPAHIVADERPTGESNAVGMAIAVLRYGHNLVDLPTILDSLVSDTDGLGYSEHYVKNDKGWHHLIAKHLTKHPSRDVYSVSDEGDKRILRETYAAFEDKLDSVESPSSETDLESSVRLAEAKISDLERIERETQLTMDDSDYDVQLEAAKRMGRAALKTKKVRTIEKRLEKAESLIGQLGDASSMDDLDRIRELFGRKLEDARLIAKKIDVDLGEDVAELEFNFEEAVPVAENRIERNIQQTVDRLVYELKSCIWMESLGRETVWSDVNGYIETVRDLAEYEFVDVGVDLDELEAEYMEAREARQRQDERRKMECEARRVRDLERQARAVIDRVEEGMTDDEWSEIRLEFVRVTRTISGFASGGEVADDLKEDMIEEYKRARPDVYEPIADRLFVTTVK